MNSHEVFIHIHQGCFAGIGAIVRLPQCQWSKPGGYGKISQCITTTKHSKAKTVCIFLGIYCMADDDVGTHLNPWYGPKWHWFRASTDAVFYMMTFSNGSIFCITSPLFGEFTGHRWIPLTKGQWRGPLMFCLICVWINGWVNNREADDLKHHRTHYDFPVM